MKQMILLKNFLNLLKKRYYERLEKSGREAFFVFLESVDLFYYSLHKTKLRKGKSYVESPE